MLIYGEDKEDYQTLLLGPGGYKGFLLLGYLDYLYRKTNKLRDVSTYCGVSIGSFLSLMLIVGYDPHEILNIMLKIVNLVYGENINIFTLPNNKGIFKLEKVREYLTEKISEKLSVVPTLKGLYNLTGKSLITVAYNISKDEVTYFNPLDTPNVSCIDAIFASCSVPILFETYNINGEHYVDGAIGDPFPINFIDDGKHNILSIMMISQCIDMENLNIANYLDKIISTNVRHKAKNLVTENDNIRHVVLDTNVECSLTSTLEDKNIFIMIWEGYRYAEQSGSFQYIPKNIHNKFIYPNKEEEIADILANILN